MSEAAKTETTTTEATTTAAETKTEAAATETKTEAKTEGTQDAKTTETKSEASQETKAEEKVVPEKYVLKVKDGLPLSKHDLDYVENFAREQKLSNDEAQAVLDQQVDFVKRQLKAQDEALTAALQSDPEIGGDKLQQTLQNTKKFLDRFDKDGTLAASLDRYGISKDPKIVKAFAAVGASLRDDTHVSSHGGSSGGGKPLAQRLYGDTMNG